MPKTDAVLLAHTTAIHSEMTQPAREVSTALRPEHFDDAKLSRQVVIGSYIADFVAKSRKLMIGLDGDTHANTARNERRTVCLDGRGYRIFRFSNAEVIHNLSGLQVIGDALVTAPLPNPLPRGERA